MFTYDLDTSDILMIWKQRLISLNNTMPKYKSVNSKVLQDENAVGEREFPYAQC